MKFLNRYGKYITGAVFLITLVLIVFNFNAFFPALSHSNLSSSRSRVEKPIDIPSNLNFLNDDKKAYLDYCKSVYGDTLPLSVDTDTFIYYGAVDGYRLYRIQSNLIPFEHAHISEKIDGYTFFSDCIYRPSKTGLYIIGDKGVFTVENVYMDGIINISDVYNLYIEKTVAENPGLSESEISTSNQPLP